MQLDNIPIDRMLPDASLYQKGLQLAMNVIPAFGTWRELTTPVALASEALPAATSAINVGTFSDPLGSIWVGTTHPGGPSSRLYEFAPSTDTFTNRTPATNYAGAPARWYFTKFGASVIAAPENIGSGAALQLQVRSGAGNFANLVTSVDRPDPKFICTCRSHVVGAFNIGRAGAGLYAAADPYQYMWCSRNNAAIWTPGVDRAGFAPSSDDLGELTGICGFKEFFLLFYELGVVRVSWVGGDVVWEPQGIGEYTFGLNAAWSPGTVKANRDCYYWSNAGPAVIRHGEAPVFLGDGQYRRFFLDQSETYELDPTNSVEGEFNENLDAIVWSWGNPTFRHQAIYEVRTDRFSILDGSPLATGVGSGRRITEIYPLWSTVLFGMSGANLQAIRFTTIPGSRTTAAAKFYTKRWRPQTGQRSVLHAIRPLAIMDLNGGVVPQISILIEAASDPSFTVVQSATLTALSKDENGWWTSSVFPMEGNEFRFTITLQIVGGQPIIREFPALELAFEPVSVF